LAAGEAALAGVDGVDVTLDALAERMRAAAVELDDLASELRGYLDSIEAEPGRLEPVEERLEAVDRLTRKHGGSVEAVLEHAERCRERVEQLANADQRAAELERAIAAAEAERDRLAARLGASRADAARALSERVAAELSELAMDGARLEVALEPHPGGFGPSGAETVEFLVATNPGMPVSPLKDAASGGELSRIMLALTGLASGARRTLVFDEIDAGIGGSTARAVGERLRALAEHGQVLCITHLPQVASLASTHFKIDKRTVEGETRAMVERVDGDSQVDEIVRMLGAARGDRAASRHARDLLEAA
jgi:DNA repair protein RecN (Recombination protein N)